MKKLTIILLLFSCNLGATAYYVAGDNLCASDSNNGTSYSCAGGNGPFKTINKAVSVLSDNDSIIIGKGTYFERIVIASLNNIHISAYGDGEVLISGAMPEYAVANNNLWTYEGTRYSDYHQASFKVYYSDYLPQHAPDNTSLFTIADNNAYDETGKQLYTYADSVLFTQHHVKARFGEGVYFDTNRMYIAFEDQNKNPNDLPVYISRFGHTVLIWKASVTIDGGVDRLINISHIGRYGVSSNSNNELIPSQLTLRYVKITGGNAAVSLAPNAGESIIEYNSFIGGFDALWSWNDVKKCLGNPGDNGDQTKSGCSKLRDLNDNPNPVSGLKTQESSAIVVNTSAMTIVRMNKISSYFNGVVVLKDNSTIEENSIWDIYDDAIEIEGRGNGPVSNVIVRKNKVWDSHVAFSGVTIKPGPVYVYENIFVANKAPLRQWNFADEINSVYYDGRPMKYYSLPKDLTTNTHFYYNTFYSIKSPLWVGIRCSVSDYAATNTSVFNNIYLAEETISYFSGREADGVGLKSNILFSKGSPAFKYRCWNGGGNYPDNPPMPSNWTNNTEANPGFKEGNIDLVDAYFQINQNSPSREANGFVLELIPNGWSGFSELNASRTNAGAIEFEEFQDLIFTNGFEHSL